MTWEYSVTLRSLLVVAFLEPAGAFAADDDIVAAEGAPTTAHMRNMRILQQQNRRGLIVQANGIAIQVGQFDQMVFGMDGNRGQKRVDALIEQKIRELSRIYVLSDEKLNKLKLAARVDRVRFDTEVDQLRRRYEAAGDNIDQIVTISNEAAILRRKQFDLIGNDSFFAKAAKRILADATLKTARFPSANDPKSNLQNQAHRHISNIESAIGDVNRRVSLQDSQKQAIAELLLKETRPAKVFGDFDDILVKYRLSQLPEDKLKPLFDEKQWPRVRQVLDGFLEFRPSLVRRGLIAEEQPKAKRNQDATRFDQPADAILPDNGKEKVR